LYCNLFCLNNKGKQGRWNKFKRGGTDNCKRSEQKDWTVVCRIGKSWQTATVYKFRGPLSGPLFGSANIFQS